MASWKADRTYAGKTSEEIYQSMKRTLDELSDKYGLRHRGDDARLSGKVTRTGVDGRYQVIGEVLSLELDFGFLIPGAVRQKVQAEVDRRLDGLFS